MWCKELNMYHNDFKHFRNSNNPLFKAKSFQEVTFYHFCYHTYLPAVIGRAVLAMEYSAG